MDKETFKKEIGFRIKVERMRRKISQEKLAEMADCSLSYIGFVERGEMSLSLYNFGVILAFGSNTKFIL